MRSPSYQDGAEPLPGRGRIPIVLRVSSQKGGVGKTTISVNLAARLSMMGYTVLLIDGDTVNPAISFLLGVNEIDHSVREVLQGRIDIRSAMRKHDSTGMYVVLGDPADTSFLPTSVQLRNFIGQIRLVRDFDFVIIDTPPGFTGSPIESIYEEALVVTLPSTASCASAIRLSEFYDENEVRHELVINRVRNTSSELSVKEVESAVGTEAISVLPEDKIISRSEDMHMPAVIWDRGSKFSKSLTRLAAVYATKRGTPERPPVKESGFFRKLFWSR